MSTDERGDAAAYIEAGLAAVRLLHKLVELIPLRSDSQSIRAEIARIERTFQKEGGAPPNFRRSA